MRVGQIILVEEFEARLPSYKVQINFGDEIGLKWSIVGAKQSYLPSELINLQVIGVINFPPKKIAGFFSEVLLLGVPSTDGLLSLLVPNRLAQLGSEVY